MLVELQAQQLMVLKQLKKAFRHRAEEKEDIPQRAQWTQRKEIGNYFKLIIPNTNIDGVLEL